MSKRGYPDGSLGHSISGMGVGAHEELDVLDAADEALDAVAGIS